ncbi:MAG: hypothetical protein Q8Q89_00140 [bacterium]|nr:hypothetical protein [bacterium]
MSVSVRPKPNLTWIVVPILMLLWSMGFISGLIAVLVFVVYFAVMFMLMKRNPVIQKEAQEFAQKSVENLRAKEKERVKQSLLNSVEVRPITSVASGQVSRLTHNERARLQRLEETKERRRWNEEYPDDNETPYGW